MAGFCVFIWSREGEHSWRFGTLFGSFEALRLIARGGNLSDVKFTQRNGKLVSG